MLSRLMGVRVVLLSMLAGGPCAAQTRPIVFPPADSSVPSRPVNPDAPSADVRSGLKTSVEFEILSSSPSAGLDAHHWTQALQKFGVRVRVRTPKLADELGVTEKVRGTLRWVTATGQLDTGGKLTFPNRSFTLRQSQEIKEWIDELKLYGAQGAPEGKPLWGLTYDQFDAVFQSLSLPVSEQVQGLTMHDALRKMPLPADMPVRFHSAATKHLAALRPVGAVRPAVQGMSAGSALAAVLANDGLGYRPLRTPAGTLELVVEPLTNLKQPWPIGWELPKDASRGKLAPGLFKMVPVGFNDIPLQDVLGAVSDVAGLPVVVNHYSAAQKGINLRETLVSYPQKRAAYIMVLGSVVRRSRLTEDLRVDERGQPFLYVTAFVPKTIEDLSPAESK